MKATLPYPRTIVSGGQTGVDRAALDVAIQLEIPHTGWCPLGRLAEDGCIPSKYQLRETDSPQYWVRTEQNVLDSEGTLILFRKQRQGGTEFTFRMTKKHRKPCWCVDLNRKAVIADVREWLESNQIARLNVAGPRESTSPGIYREALHFLQCLLHAE